jgi:hypothetical protein
VRKWRDSDNEVEETGKKLVTLKVTLKGKGRKSEATVVQLDEEGIPQATKKPKPSGPNIC